MHPDNDYVVDRPDDEQQQQQQQESISTIPLNWLQTNQWNLEECLQWKSSIENDLIKLEKLRCSTNEFDNSIVQQIRFLEV